MLATAQSQWPTADSIAVRALSDSATQGLFRINATTAHASALAAQGSVLAADSVLRNAVSLSKGSPARWYERARLLLWLCAGRPLGSRALSAADTTLPATMLRALYDAQFGDTARATLSLPKTGELSARNVALIGAGPEIVRSLIASRAGSWKEVIDSLGPVALGGEQDPTMLDRPDSFLERWIVADAYERAGKLDSAAVYFELLLKPTRIPAGHFALRGFTYGFAHYRLAEIRHRTGDNAEETRHRDALKKAFVHSDRVTAELIAGHVKTR